MALEIIMEMQFIGCENRDSSAVESPADNIMHTSNISVSDYGTVSDTELAFTYPNLMELFQQTLRETPTFSCDAMVNGKIPNVFNIVKYSKLSSYQKRKSILY